MPAFLLSKRVKPIPDKNGIGTHTHVFFGTLAHFFGTLTHVFLNPNVLFVNSHVLFPTSVPPFFKKNRFEKKKGKKGRWF